MSENDKKRLFKLGQKIISLQPETYRKTGVINAIITEENINGKSVYYRIAESVSCGFESIVLYFTIHESSAKIFNDKDFDRKLNENEIKELWMIKQEQKENYLKKISVLEKELFDLLNNANLSTQNSI